MRVTYGERKWSAVRAALAVFAVLYLGEGLRLFGGYNALYVLWWPGQMTARWASLGFNLGAFALVALYVYWLKVRLRRMEEELEVRGYTSRPVPARLRAARS